MFFPKSWFSGRRAALSARRSHVVGLEDRTLLAAVISWSTPSPTSFRVEGTTGDDTITVSLTGGGNFDVNGTDTGIASAGRTIVNVSALDGVDLVVLDASLGAIGSTVLGGIGDDTILAFNSGSNSLKGQAGADFYLGGAGNDKYEFDELDTFLGDAGGSVDHIDASLSGVGVTLALGLTDIERYTGSAFADSIDATGETGVVVILGGDGNDTLTGGSGNDVLRGNLGNDRLNGGGGNDILIGNEGNDTIDGGSGADNIDYSTSTAGITASLSVGLVTADGLGGQDTILSQSVENVIGSNFADGITGNAAANFLRGNGGDDVIVGGLGDDELEGGDGIDNLRGQGGMDRVDGGNDNDIIQADSDDDQSLRFAGGAGDDSLIYENINVAVNWVLKANSSFQSITGTNLADTIDASLQLVPVTLAVGGGMGGGAGADTLIGTAFNDKLVGGAGNDTLIGGLGTDSLRGGTEDDLLIGGTLLTPDDGVADSLIGDAGNDTAVGLVAGTPGTTFLFDTRTLLENVI